MTKDELFKLIDLKVDGLRNRAIIKDAVEDYSSASNNGKPIVSGSLQSAMNEIENAMERWHHARDNDDETLQKINDILVSIGKLSWFNKQ